MMPTIKMCYLQTWNTVTAFFPFKSDHLVHFRGWVVSGKSKPTCLLCIFFYCGKMYIHEICHLNYLKVCSMALSTFVLLCNYHNHPSPRTFSSSQIEMLASLATDFPFLPRPGPAGNHHSTLCLCEFDYSRYLL